MSTERLQKILSSCGVASRRAAETIIKDGRVTVNGVIAELGQSADILSDLIEVDGKKLEVKKQHIYLMLNKPCGYLTTVIDDRGRKTVMELVYDAGVRVYPVGRLDLDSEGLLIFTNDGEFANRLAHPSRKKEKEYKVRVRGDITKAALLLGKPITLHENDNTKTTVVKASCIEILSKSKEDGELKITIVEGRNRQIRKMCEICGLKVLSLKRVSIAGVELGSLETGKWRYLTENEVKILG